jgi:hypothetical protein
LAHAGDKSILSAFPPLLEGQVDVGIVEDQQAEGDHADGDEAEPIEVDRVDGVLPEAGGFDLWHDVIRMF